MGFLVLVFFFLVSANQISFAVIEPKESIEFHARRDAFDDEEEYLRFEHVCKRYSKTEFERQLKEMPFRSLILQIETESKLSIPRQDSIDKGRQCNDFVSLAIVEKLAGRPLTNEDVCQDFVSLAIVEKLAGRPLTNEEVAKIAIFNRERAQQCELKQCELKKKS